MGRELITHTVFEEHTHTHTHIGSWVEKTRSFALNAVKSRYASINAVNHELSYFLITIIMAPRHGHYAYPVELR